MRSIPIIIMTTIAFFLAPPVATKSVYKCGQLNEKRDSNNNAKVVDGEQLRWHKYPWVVRLSVFYEPTGADMTTKLTGNQSCDIISTKHSQLRQSVATQRGQLRTVTSLCGGTVISPKHILTAGHCLMPLETKPRYVVHYGSAQTDLQVTAFVSRVVKHPKCVLINTDRAINDLAILELKTSLPIGKSFVPACLPKKSLSLEDDKSAVAVVTGWGNTIPSIDNLDLPDSLKEAEMKIIDSTECKKQHSYADLSGQICAVSRSGFPGIGDSGGPLLYAGDKGWTVVGVVSWGNETRFREAPFVFTNVAQHRNWIDSVIKL